MLLLCSGRILTIRGYRVNPAEVVLLSIGNNVRNRREEAFYFRRIPHRAHLLRMNPERRFVGRPRQDPLQPNVKKLKNPASLAKRGSPSASRRSLGEGSDAQGEEQTACSSSESAGWILHSCPPEPLDQETTADNSHQHQDHRLPPMNRIWDRQPATEP